MFESLGLENPRNPRRNWTTAASFALQTTGLALLVLAPIGYTEAVAPKWTERIVAPIGMVNNNAQPTAPTHESPTVSPVPFHEGGVVYVNAGARPHPYPTAADNNLPVDPKAFPVAGGTSFAEGSMMDKLLEGTHPAEVGSPVTTHAKPLPISHLDAGMLIKQVQPVYPAIAKQTHTEGKVLLVAVIDTQGRIENLRALSGHPFLIPAAIDAVQQWRYRPYILNGQPVEVETQITVNFTLQQN
jgi:protein TonB